MHNEAIIARIPDIVDSMQYLAQARPSFRDAFERHITASVFDHRVPET